MCKSAKFKFWVQSLKNFMPRKNAWQYYLLTFCIFGRCDLEFLHRCLGNGRPGEGNYLQQCGPEAGIWVHKAAQKCRKFRQQNFPIVATSAVSCQTLHTDLKSRILFRIIFESNGMTKFHLTRQGHKKFSNNREVERGSTITI